MLFPTNQSDLISFINNEDNSIFSFDQMNYNQLLDIENEIDTFVQLHGRIIKEIPANYSNGRAFLFLLLDLCERLRLRSSFTNILQIINSNNIAVGSRLKAAILFNHVPSNDQYIIRFEQICELLQEAIDYEEDTDNKALATFCNYYISVLDVHPNWIKQLREKIDDNRAKYPFLNEIVITRLLSIDISDSWEAILEALKIKDKLFDRTVITLPEVIDLLLMEKNTSYANSLSTSARSFTAIRKIALNRGASEMRLKDRGVKPLYSEDEMFLYFKSYGNMHYAKIMSALNYLTDQVFDSIDSGKLEIIDYGCGQAMATMVLAEFLNKKSISPDSINVTLIEPSEIVLKRAALHTKHFIPHAQIKTVLNDLDRISNLDLRKDCDSIKIHLFSNILDVELFSLEQLLSNITQSLSGNNLFICVSPDINDFKTNRIERFKNYFKKHYNSFHLYGEARNSKMSKTWLCNNIHKGSECYNHTENGCDNKWTRVMEVFEVNLN